MIKRRLTQPQQDRDQPFAGATSRCNELGTQRCDSGHQMRVNARLEDFLLLDELTVRGLEKVTLHSIVGLLVMLAGAQAMVTAEQWERVRQVGRLAA